MLVIPTHNDHVTTRDTSLTYINQAWLGLSPIDTVTPHGLSMLRNCYLDFAVEHWFGCCYLLTLLPTLSSTAQRQPFIKYGQPALRTASSEFSANFEEQTDCKAKISCEWDLRKLNWLHFPVTNERNGITGRRGGGESVIIIVTLAS